MNKKLNYFLTFLALLFLQGVMAQGTTVAGTVSDNNGSPLPGVNVVEKGTSNGTSTDFDGNYSITVNDGAILVFSSLGYASKEATVNGSSLNVSLDQDASQLDEVVVTALGLKRKVRALGYALTEVNGEELATVRNTNAINSLQGKVAGVNITQNSTGAAGSSRVIIRGVSSLNGNNQPLYVVDGIPIGNNNNGAASLWGGSDGGDGISSINPDDIESVSVLKGGAAAALYGSGAGNGAIIITTKSGKNQNGFGVEFNSSVTFDQVNTSLQDYQTEYGQGERGVRPTSQTEALEAGFASWGERFDGGSAVQYDGTSRPYSYTGSNLDKFYRTGSTFVNSVAISSGTEKGNFRFSLTDLDNKDVIPNAGLNRKTFSLNANSILAKKINVAVNAKYIVEKVNNRPRLSDSPGNANFTVAVLPGNIDVTDLQPATNEDGSERGFTDNPFSQNPYFAAFNFRNEDLKNRFIASTTINYDILDWLKLTARVGTDHYTIKRVAVEPFGTAYKPLGGINENEFRYTQIDADLILRATKKISDKFAFDALIGINSNDQKEEQLNLGGNDFIVPGLEDIGNTLSQSRGRDYSQIKKGGAYGQLELSYDNWAYLTVTGRNDWFSTLSFPGKTTPNNYFYPSVSFSAVLTDAIKFPDFINYFRLRAGYADVAQGADNAYALSLNYEIFGNPINGQPLGRISGNNIPNSLLIPTSIKDTEIGFDARFFDKKLRIDFAYYNRSISQEIVAVTTSLASSFNGATQNIGEFENKGFEFLVETTPIRGEDFSWTTSINGTHNTSEILGTDPSNGAISLDEPRTRNVRIEQIVGEPVGSIVGVSYDRDDNGNIRYEIDGDGVPRAVEGERKILGVGVPPWQIGFSNQFRYKNFILSFLIDGKFGGQIFSGTNSILYGNGLHKGTLPGREGGLSVSGIDATTDLPFTTNVAPENLETYYGRISRIAEQFVQDSDYIQFRQLSLGYSLPKKALENIFVNSVNISIIGSNLFFLKRDVDNIDPESAYNVSNSQGLEYFGVPSTRRYGLNLKVAF